MRRRRRCGRERLATSPRRRRRVLRPFERPRRSAQEKDIRVLWHMFKKHDKERRSIIAISDFYDKIVFVPRTIFCDGLFDLIEAADSESIDFGEFVAAVTTYCFFEIPEVLKFCFFVFDRDKKGFITQEEMRLFVDAMHGIERRPGAFSRSYAVDATHF